MIEPEGVHTQEPSSQQGAQPRPRGQFTPVVAYEQLANLLRANPDTSPLIAQALHNLQQGPPGGQGTGMGPDLLQHSRPLPKIFLTESLAGEGVPAPDWPACL